MKVPRVQRKGSEGTLSGFRSQDQHALDQVNDHIPKVTVISTYSEEDEQLQDQFCPKCESLLSRLEKYNDQVMQCRGCGDIIDVSASSINNDPPLRNVNQSMTPYQSQHFDANNPEGSPYFVSWNPDSGDTTVNKDYEITYSSADRRVKKIRCKDGFPRDISINAFDD